MSFGFKFLRELPSEKVGIANAFRHPTSLFYTNMSSWKDLSGFTYGRNEVSPDSEQIELTMPARHNSETLWAWSKSKTNYLIQDLATAKQLRHSKNNPTTVKSRQWLDAETSSEWRYNNNGRQNVYPI